MLDLPHCPAGEYRSTITYLFYEGVDFVESSDGHFMVNTLKVPPDLTLLICDWSVSAIVTYFKHRFENILKTE